MTAGILLGVGRWLIGTQVGQVVLIVAATLIAFFGWTWKVQRDAERAAMERVLAETMEESSRRLRELHAIAVESAAREAALAEAAAERAKLIGEIHVLSQANNDRVCIDPAGVMRLDSLRGRPPGRGARQPGG